MTPAIKLQAKQAFADVFLFYLQAHYYHWNVEGRHFAQDHELFGKIYEDVQGSIDKFAEELRTLDTFAPGVFNRFMDLAGIEQESTIPGSDEMYKRLIASNEKVITGLTELFMMLEDNHLHGFGDFIAGRIDAHNKHQWMLRSTLK
jgi:starvation-inducible DNA-binding protein